MQYNSKRENEKKPKRKPIMKKLTSLLLILSVLFSLCALLTSCGEQKPELIVYTEAGFAPWETTQGTDVVGVDIEIAKYIAEKYGYKLTVINGNFDTIVAGISEDNAIGLAGISWSEERAEKVAFSNFYYEGAIQCVIYPTANASSLVNENGEFAVSNLAGKTVGVQTGTTGHMFADGNKEDWGCDVKSYSQYLQAVQDMKDGVVDYIIVDNSVAEQLCQNNSGYSYSTCEGAEPEKYAAVAKLGNTELIEKVNAAIAELLVKNADGKSQIDLWLEQYMG